MQVLGIHISKTTKEEFMLFTQFRVYFFDMKTQVKMTKLFLAIVWPLKL